MRREKVKGVISKVIDKDYGWTISLHVDGDDADPWLDVYPEDNVGVPRVGDIATVLVPVVVGIEGATP